METRVFEALGLHEAIGWTWQANGHANLDVFSRSEGPGDAPYHPCPESHPAAHVPRGTVRNLYNWAGSEIFPRTKRDINVYVPAQLSPGDNPALLICNDSHFYLDPHGAVRATAVLDSLNHLGEIPLTAAIFVTAGTPLDLPSTREQREGATIDPSRRLDGANQRSYEYDRLTDDYPRFLIEELLPVAEELLGTTFTDDASKRAVCGISSGGIAAFNAAWHRPECFGAVISHCGSFTNIECGHNYPFLVRSTERKPIKVWMQSGANDNDVPWGNWALANQQMAAALEFAGYEVKFEFGTGGHNPRHGGAMFANMFRWLWGDGSYAKVFNFP